MPLLLLVLFIGVPILELMTIGRVQDFLGWPVTVGILVADSVLGAYLVRMQGALAWRRFTEALGEHRLPAEEVVDGALILFGGALLLTPGFLTDIVGLFMVFTPSRKLLNRLVRARITMAAGPMGTMFLLGGKAARKSSQGRRDRKRQTPPGPGVIDVEVVDVSRSTPPPEPGQKDQQDRQGPADGRSDGDAPA
ncbi:hypothetical protein BH23ACT9_BH23ACT9_30300 [soil metagenome]